MDANRSGPSGPSGPSGAWWTYGHVWLVIAGPAAVVVAGFATLYLALTRPDPVIADDYYRRAVNIGKTAGQATASLAPALQGRNHAATPVAPPVAPGTKP